MKFKITVSQVLKEDGAGNEVFETVYLQVLDLDENPASDIARLLNPEPEYEEDDEAEIAGGTARVFPNVTFNLKPTTLADTLKSETPMSVYEVSLPKEFGTLEAEKDKPTLETHTKSPQKRGRQHTYDLNTIIADFESGEKAVKQIAEEQSVTYNTIAALKRRWENGNLKREADNHDEDETEEEGAPKAAAHERNEDVPWFFNDVLDLLRDGYNDTQIYHEMYTKITDTQYRGALEWAKKQDA